MKNKTIGIFFPSFNIGGVERVMIDLANALFAKGIHILVIVCNNSGELKSTLNEKIRISSTNKPLRKSLFALRKILIKEKIDVIISGPDFPNFISILATRCLRYPKQIIITQHNLFNIESKGLGFHGKITPWLYKILYPISNKIIGVSEATVEMLKKYGIDGKKIQKINNPINVKEVIKLSEAGIEDNLKETSYIVFVGRLSKIKNLQLLINAFKEIAVQFKELKLLIIGDGSERESLESFGKSVSNNIIFTGAKSNPYPYIKNAKLLVLPSFSEAYPCVLIESMLLGVTPIVTPTSGAKEITQDGKYGYLCNSFSDSKLLAETIMKGISSPISNEILYSYSSQFDVSKVVDKYLSSIEN